MLNQYDDDLSGLSVGQRINSPQPGDDRLYVKFYNRVIEDPIRTKEEGRPICEEVPYIEMMAPGDKDSLLRKRATVEHINRFPKHWEAFQRQQDQEALEGTPLSEWSGVNRAQVEELRYFHIRTVEHLADVQDGAVGNVPGLVGLRERARAYLEHAKDQALSNKLLEAEKRNAELEGYVKDLSARVDALQAMADQPKRRGRPPKED